MAVSIPRINRAEPIKSLPQNDRINMKVSDNSSLILNQTQQVASLGDKGMDLYQQIENEKIETLSNGAEREYKAWNDQELAKLKSYEGDPTDAYVEYDKRAKEKREEILNSRPDLNDRVKTHFTSRLDKAIYDENITAMRQRGMQQEVFANNDYEATLKLRKNDLPLRAGEIKAGEDDSYSRLNERLDDIKTVVAKRGLTKGTVRLAGENEAFTHKYIDDEGKEVRVVMSQMAKQRVAKEVGEGLKSSIEVLMADGRIEDAKDLRDRYKAHLDPKDNLRLTKKFEGADTKEQAYKFLDGLRGKSPEAKWTAIEGIESSEIRAEVIKIQDAEEKKIEDYRKRRDDTNYEKLAKLVMTKQESGQPFFGISDLENDKNYKLMVDNLSPKSRKALTEMIEAPSVSSDKSLLKVQNLFYSQSEELEGMSPEKFYRDYLTGLSKPDKNRYLKEFNRVNNPSSTQERMVYKQADSLIRKALKYEGEDDDTIYEVQKQVSDHLLSRKTLPSENEVRDLVNEAVSAYKEDRIFNPKKIKKKSAPSLGTGQGSETPVTIDILSNYSNLEVIKMRAEYAKSKGLSSNPPKEDQGFLNWVKKKG